MKINLKSIAIMYLGIFTVLTSCGNDGEDNTDTQKPTISINYANGFPQPCEALQRGQNYIFRAQLTDNFDLAAYSIEIHENFDHHTHDNQEIECDIEEDKEPLNPFLYLENFSIVGSTSTYEIAQSISIPNDVDTGDYHCQLSVTDQTGWQSIIAIDIKIIE